MWHVASNMVTVHRAVWRHWRMTTLHVRRDPSAAKTVSYYYRVTWASWHPMWPIIRLFVQQAAKTKGSIEAPDFWPFAKWIHEWFPHQGQVMRETFPCHYVIMLRCKHILFLVSGRNFDCTRYLIGEQGVVESPHFPNELLYNLNCVYVITNPHGRVALVFETFDLGGDGSGCTSEYVQVQKLLVQRSPGQLGIVYTVKPLI